VAYAATSSSNSIGGGMDTRDWAIAYGPMLWVLWV
jgi:hypothetical protein